MGATSIRTHLSIFGCLAIVSLATILLCYYFTLTTSPYIWAASNPFTIQIVGPSKPPGFFPMLVTVHEGDPVVFVNDATPPTTYTLVADDGSFSSPPIASGQRWSVTFKEAAVHEYHISTSSQKMVGEIVVVPSSVKLLPTPVPAAEATAFADIRAGKQPPVLVAHASSATISSTASNNIEEIAIIVAVCLLVSGASLGGFLVYRHRHL